MSSPTNNSGSRRSTYALRYGATKLNKVDESPQTILTVETATPTKDASSLSYRKRISGHLTRLTSLRGHKRSGSMSEPPTSTPTRQEATKQSISSPTPRTPESRQSYPSDALLRDPNSFVDPRPAPRPPIQEDTTAGRVTSSRQSEAYDGTILTSALDSEEVQKASLMALQLAADHPHEAAAVRRTAEAARIASAAAEQARAAAVVAGGEAARAGEAARRAQIEVAYLVRLLKDRV